jgi:hypothetical protein
LFYLENNTAQTSTTTTKKTATIANAVTFKQTKTFSILQKNKFFYKLDTTKMSSLFRESIAPRYQFVLIRETPL